MVQACCCHAGPLLAWTPQVRTKMRKREAWPYLSSVLRTLSGRSTPKSCGMSGSRKHISVAGSERRGLCFAIEEHRVVCRLPAIFSMHCHIGRDMVP